ncbi:hypothetical protein [Methanosarcina sp. UBA289]|uniref:hypothetical protein n=1 Tax=Methanosarcina sp. UBA289 TaxID=1915574 RepID=UPI0025CF5317|nr:hypothetical protein [Methanosarcina sp. UBA289]
MYDEIIVVSFYSQFLPSASIVAVGFVVLVVVAVEFAVITAELFIADKPNYIHSIPFGVLFAMFLIVPLSPVVVPFSLVVIPLSLVVIPLNPVFVPLNPVVVIKFVPVVIPFVPVIVPRCCTY